MGWNDAADKCSISRHCPNGDVDCPGSETCWNYLPGCNIVDLMKENNVVPTVSTTTQNKPAYGPASPPSRPPSRQPTSQITPAPVRPATNAPTKWTIQWIDDEGEETGEEDWSDSVVKETNLYCGETLVDAATNCRKSGYHCPDGICSNGLKCFAIAEGDCGDGASNIISTILNPPHAAETVTQTTHPPVSSPSDDIAETFYCGIGKKMIRIYHYIICIYIFLTIFQFSNVQALTMHPFAGNGVGVDHLMNAQVRFSLFALLQHGSLVS